VRVLILGGTGNLSRPCALEALERGHEVTVLTRGRRPGALPATLEQVEGDVADEGLLRRLAERHFDAVIQFLAFDADAAARDVRVFGGRAGHYVFISTAAAYQRPPAHYRVTEATPLSNPRWPYARRKIEAEGTLRETAGAAGLPWTVIRPSYTYGESWIPTTSGTDYTVAWRMRRGLEVPVPGDGSSLWTLTHASDLARGVVGLLGREEARGEAFHITSDEVLNWNQIHETLARVLGVEAHLVHIPSEVIARIAPERGASLLGDKAWSVVFDNAKIRGVLPGFRAEVDFETGVARSLRWFEADPVRQTIARNEGVERILAAWHRAMAALDGS
jgi:nucleoside-diphosphate-sugar epimerase